MIASCFGGNARDGGTVPAWAVPAAAVLPNNAFGIGLFWSGLNYVAAASQQPQSKATGSAAIVAVETIAAETRRRCWPRRPGPPTSSDKVPTPFDAAPER